MAPLVEPPVLALAGPDHSRIEASAQGAQALSWRCRGSERLYLSPNAVFLPAQAIRGGVPVIFPQFSGLGPGPKHGFARTHLWRPVAQTDLYRLSFALDADDATMALWPHRFSCKLSLSLDSDSMTIELTVHNRDEHAFEFTAALHTYLRVADLSRSLLLGLEDVPYRLAADVGLMHAADDTPLRFDAEVDRIYATPSRPLRLTDGDSVLRIAASGFADTVVWNPGAEGGARLHDLEPDGYRHFVCVEAAAVLAPVKLAPGASWAGEQRLTLEP